MLYVNRKDPAEGKKLRMLKRRLIGEVKYVISSTEEGWPYVGQSTFFFLMGRRAQWLEPGRLVALVSGRRVSPLIVCFLYNIR